MSSKGYTEFPKDDKGHYYLENNKKIYFVRDNTGYYYPNVNGDKVYLLKDNLGYYYQDNQGNKTYIYKTKKETNITTDLDINKLSTHLMRILYSSGYINENIHNPNNITNTIKIELNKFVNPGYSRCKAIISNKNGSTYPCNAPVKPGSEYCGRKHKK
jgi:hypothetical protein